MEAWDVILNGETKIRVICSWVLSAINYVNETHYDDNIHSNYSHNVRQCHSGRNCIILIDFEKLIVKKHCF